MDDAPARRPMDVLLLTGIALSGALIGLLASLGVLLGTWELVAWLVVGTAAIITALRRIPDDTFRHLAFGFMLAGFIGADVKILLWDRFLANHPAQVQQAMANGVETIPRSAVIVSDTITGAIMGLVFGGLAAYLSRRTAAHRTSSVDEEE